MSRWGILREVSAERDQQIAKWGDQRLRNFRSGAFRDPEAPSVRTGTRRAMLGLAATTEEFRTRCEVAEKSGILSFADVLMEEVSEAMDAENEVELRAELIQVAAVAVKWIEALDKQSAKDGGPPFPKLTEDGRVPIDPTLSFAEQEERDLDGKLATVPAEFRSVVVPHFHHSINSLLKHMGEPHPNKGEHRMYHMGQLASMVHYWAQFTVAAISATYWGAVWFPEGSFVAKIEGDMAIVARKTGGPLRLYTIKDGQLVPQAPK